MEVPVEELEDLDADFHAPCDEELQEEPEPDEDLQEEALLLERLLLESPKLQLLEELMALFHRDLKISLQFKGKESLCGLLPI